MMAYKYVDTLNIKGLFELSANSYAQVVSKCEFEVIAGNKTYTFKTGKNIVLENVVERINDIIKDFYEL